VVRSLRDIQHLEDPSSLQTTFHATMMQSEVAKRRAAQAASSAAKVSRNFQGLGRCNTVRLFQSRCSQAKEDKSPAQALPQKSGSKLSPITSLLDDRGLIQPRSTSDRIRRPQLTRQDTLVGDPRRRPRWGIPFKFDIAHVIATNIDVGIMDLLMAKAHYTGSHEDTAIHIPFIELENDQLTRGEHKRLGGIYLGELVWALINILIVKILMTKPTKLVLNSTLAAAFAVRDVAHYTVARTLELAMNVPRSLQDGRTNNVSACFLRVRLMSGRYLVKHGGKGAISTHCVVQLRSEDDRESNLIDQDTSKISLWSKSPRWKETFFLGPVSILKDTQLKVLCVHQERVPGKSGYWDTLSSSAVGELNVPLLAIGTTKVSLDTSKMFLNHRQKATPTRELVGWFQLGLPTAAANDLFPLEGAVSDGQSRQARCVENSYSHSSQAIHFAPHCRQVNVLTGQIKLGLRIISPERLRV